MALHHRLRDRRLLIATCTIFGVAVATLGGFVILGVLFSGGSCACQPPPPKFVFEETDETTVVITSTRGDFRAHTLTVSVDGNTTPWTAHGNATGQLGTDTAVVTGDTSVVSAVEQGDEIEVLWTPQNQNESQVMSRYVVGENRSSAP